MSAAERKKSVYGVSQINAYIRNMLAQDFLLRDVLVRGEVSNCTYHSSGHIYFTLKDEKAAIACVMFAGSRKGLSFRLQEGQQVVVSGSVEVFERDGKYQLYAKRIFSDGAGTLSEKFERLKRTLEERGMFDPCYKRPLPRFIRTLGVVTAPTGAAIRDIINIAGRRNPYVQIILYPALVQGEHAAESIVRGIHALEALPVDVIIAGRGGGTLEDLWAFNEEIVAQAFFDCTVPIVSAVGHETDVALSDYVADLRAPTPSAAAELAVYDVSLFLQGLEDTRERLASHMRKRLQSERLLAQNYRLSLYAKSPEHMLREKRMRAAQAEDRLLSGIKELVTRRRHRLSLLTARLEGGSPLRKLSGGYAYVSHIKEGRALPVKSVTDVAEGELVRIQVPDGGMDARIERTERDAG